MNLFSLRALWKGLKGQSLTFSAIFAMAVMGLSFAGILRESFRDVGLWTPLIWLFPLLLTGWLAKNETKLKLRSGFRRLCAYGIILISILLSYSLWKYESHLEQKYPYPQYLNELEAEKRVWKRKGPPGKR